MLLHGSRSGSILLHLILSHIFYVVQGLQAAANIALDLDERTMPKGPLFPRCVLVFPFSGETVDQLG